MKHGSRQNDREKRKQIRIRIISFLLGIVLVICLIPGVAFYRETAPKPNVPSSAAPAILPVPGENEPPAVLPEEETDSRPGEDRDTANKQDSAQSADAGQEGQNAGQTPAEAVKKEQATETKPENQQQTAPAEPTEQKQTPSQEQTAEQKQPTEPEKPVEPEKPTEPEPEPPPPPVQDPAKDGSGNLILAEQGKKSLFRLVVDDGIQSGTDPWLNVAQIPESLAYYQKASLSYGNGTAGEKNLIFFGKCSEDPYTATVCSSLQTGQYTVRVVSDEKGNRVYLGFNGGFARMGLVDWFLENVINGKSTVTLAPGFSHTGSCTGSDFYLRPGINDKLRDPYLLYVNGTYYCYGTGWVYYKNTSGKLIGTWEGPFNCVTRPADADTNFWAPEVYALDGAYYMFTTYKSKATGHRGVAIFRSAAPEGPFTLYSDGQITPRDWDAIDGSLYVDKNGQPWLVYVHEWTSMSDGVGRMVIQKLSADLKKTEGTAVTLFGAGSPSWSKGKITDGCAIITQSDGTLTMIWSNWDSGGYCVGMVKNDSGRVDDPAAWKQLARRIYSKNTGTGYDGGHGMVFRDTDGQTYLVIHSPNAATGSAKESPALIPIREDCGTLVWDLP